MDKNMVLEGDTLRLRGISEGDAPLIVKWRSDPRVIKYLTDSQPLTLERHLDWYKNVYLADDDRIDLMIIDKQSGLAVGTAGAKGFAGGSPEISYAVGEQGALKKGFAAGAVRLVLDFLKDNAYTKATAVIHKHNKPSISFIEKLGFKLMGVYSQEDFLLYGKKL